MNTAFALKIFLEIGAILLIAYGYMNEEKVIAFERDLFKVVKFAVRKYVVRTHKRENTRPIENVRPIAGQNIRAYKPRNASAHSHKEAQIKAFPRNVA